MKFLSQNMERNREIVRLRSQKVRCREIASRFNLTEGYVGQIVKEMRRLEEWKGSPESLDGLTVRTVWLLHQAGIRSLSGLEKLISGSPAWKEELAERFSPKAAEEIGRFVEKML